LWLDYKTWWSFKGIDDREDLELITYEKQILFVLLLLMTNMPGLVESDNIEHERGGHSVVSK
jgi:hypothetical protein